MGDDQPIAQYSSRTHLLLPPTTPQTSRQKLVGKPTTPQSHLAATFAGCTTAKPTHATARVYIVQARNNARIMISGSIDLFSNRYERSGNEQFTSELSKWVFHERGHLKAPNVRHHKVGETDEPAMYRINDDLEYAVDIYEWSGTRWESYAANDFQGVYYTAFKVPDVYGVFQFRVEYQRLGDTLAYHFQNSICGSQVIRLKQCAQGFTEGDE
ncbi:hypothetical protein RJ640_001661 [Escallonia rubra]|uniref:OST48 middle domain-containing protein n=1 Tax=Escallonia rubra TaxID=112253 RepID=A0AA88UHR5_9ASTE|nr:hypothetical protein RJ640_001661 [Escallonia rubra]